VAKNVINSIENITNNLINSIEIQRTKIVKFKNTIRSFF